MIKVLFVTWDGPGSFYLQSLFLPIFKLLRQKNIIFYILQFTWAEKPEKLKLKQVCEDHGCIYLSVTVLRKPLSAGSLVTTFLGAYQIRKAIRSLGINIVMPRSTLPAVASILAMRAFPNVGLIFDADGLPHDERVEFGGMSPYSITYRLLRDFEALAVRRADAVLTRSKKAIGILAARCGSGTKLEKFSVVANGRDTHHFKPSTIEERRLVRQSLSLDDKAPLIVYVGSSLQGKYCGKQIFEFFQAVHAQRSDTHLLLLTSSKEEANSLLLHYDELRSVCHIMQVPPNDVGLYLSACDLGVVFINQTFSMQSVSAIKLGEYLLCGIPIVSTSGIGDSDDLIARDVGYFLPTLSKNQLEEAAHWFVHSVLPDRAGFQQRSRDVGMEFFSLQASVDTYADVIKEVSSQTGSQG